MEKNVLITNQMMLKEKERFNQKILNLGYTPLWVLSDQNLTEDECLDAVINVDGWLPGDDVITEKVLHKAKNKLKVISKWGTGLDSIDLVAAKALNIPVLNSPGAFANAVAEVALCYMISLGRNLHTIDRCIRRGEWQKTKGSELYASNVGIIGFGEIGQRIGELSSAFGMNISYYDPFLKKHDINTKYNAKPMSLNDLVKNNSYICLACNYSKSNHHLINHDILCAANKDLKIINVARGKLIDEKALIYALKNKVIAGAALDVFEEEPLPKSSNLLDIENVILGSHNANNGRAAVEFVHENTLKNLVSILK